MTALCYIILAGYLLANLVSFTLMGVDKWKSRRKRYRIPERMLLLWCACFGALGGWLGMQVFRHKTRHAKFTITVPVLMVAQIALLVIYFRYWR